MLISMMQNWPDQFINTHWDKQICKNTPAITPLLGPVKVMAGHETDVTSLVGFVSE
jgi:hypothetical protein